MKMRSCVLAGLLAISPLTAALAQGGTGPDLKADAKKEATDVKKGSATNPHQPAATGHAVVPGSNSTVKGDRKATHMEKKGN